jgi:hypothetical protein
MDALLIVAGCLALFAAAVHGAGGEVLVVRKLSAEMLPSTRFGGERMTRNMIHVTWHMTTIGFLTVAASLLAAGTVLDGDEARGVALVGAAAATGFAALAVGMSMAEAKSLRALLSHPAPVLLSSIAVLAWLGAL